MKKLMMISLTTLVTISTFAESLGTIEKPSIEMMSVTGNKSDGIKIIIGDDSTPIKFGTHGSTEKEVTLNFKTREEARNLAVQLLNFAD